MPRARVPALITGAALLLAGATPLAPTAAGVAALALCAAAIVFGRMTACR